MNDIKKLGKKFASYPPEKDLYFLIDRLYWLLEKIKDEPLETDPVSRSYFKAYYILLKELHDRDSCQRAGYIEAIYNEFRESEAKRAIASSLLLIKNFTEKKLIAVSLIETTQSALNSVNDLLSDSFDKSKIPDLLLQCKIFLWHKQ